MSHQVLVVYGYLNAFKKFEVSLRNQEILKKSLPSDIRSYRNPKDIDASFLGRFLLLKGIEKLGYPKEYLTDIGYSSYGKPFFKTHPKLGFSISHSGDLVVCAIGEIVQIGIDVEYYKKINLHNFKSQLTHLQWETLEASSQPEKLFYQFWVQKEALTKANGKGLIHSFSEIEIMNNIAIIEAVSWYLFSLEIDQHYCCWLALNSVAEIRIEKVF